MSPWNSVSYRTILKSLSIKFSCRFEHLNWNLLFILHWRSLLSRKRILIYFPFTDYLIYWRKSKFDFIILLEKHFLFQNYLWQSYCKCAWTVNIFKNFQVYLSLASHNALMRNDFIVVWFFQWKIYWHDIEISPKGTCAIFFYSISFHWAFLLSVYLQM